MVTTSKSINVTAFEATPMTVVSSRVYGGFEKCILDTVEVPDTGNADIIIMSPLPVDAPITSLVMGFDDLGSAGTVDIGFYKKNNDGTYTVVSANAIANDIDVHTAATAMTEYRYSVLGIETIQQPTWQLAGLSARPAYELLYIGLTTDTGTTVIGTASLKAKYTV